jgi:hypothetical protein
MCTVDGDARDASIAVAAAASALVMRVRTAPHGLKGDIRTVVRAQILSSEGQENGKHFPIGNDQCGKRRGL